MSKKREADRPQPRERPTALVVENDRWIRLVICDLLLQAGYRVAEASNGFSAIRLAERERLALVLLDLVLPEQSGLSVLAELRAAHATAHVPVIVFSPQPRVRRDAVPQADAVIAQPFAIDKLLAALSRSGPRAINRCRSMRFVTSATELATRPGAWKPVHPAVPAPDPPRSTTLRSYANHQDLVTRIHLAMRKHWSKRSGGTDPDVIGNC